MHAADTDEDADPHTGADTRENTGAGAPPPRASAAPAEAAASSASRGEPAPAAGDPALAGPSEETEPTAYAGPPDDATTTFEDLPGDLFGEPEPEPGPNPGPAPGRSDAREATSRDAGADPRHADSRDTVGPRGDATSAGGDPAADAAIDMVQTFFPGRIVALEPGSEDADDETSRDESAAARPDAGAVGGPDDEDVRPSG